MTIGRTATRLGFVVAAVVAVLVGTALLNGASVHAQNPPATYYGVASSGDQVGASIGGTVCTTVTADAAGEWVISLADGSCGGAATSGATVAFTLNGAAADQTEVWSSGGVPTDLVNGITLTVTAPAPAPAPAPEPVPAPPDTGNAGFAINQGSVSPWLALSLGLLVLAAVVGVRLAPGRVR